MGGDTWYGIIVGSILAAFGWFWNWIWRGQAKKHAATRKDLEDVRQFAEEVEQESLQGRNKLHQRIDGVREDLNKDFVRQREHERFEERMNRLEEKIDAIPDRIMKRINSNA